MPRIQEDEGKEKKDTSTACIYLISGSISLPFMGSFHLSLAVLCALSVIESYFNFAGGTAIFKQV